MLLLLLRGLFRRLLFGRRLARRLLAFGFGRGFRGRLLFFDALMKLDLAAGVDVEIKL